MIVMMMMIMIMMMMTRFRPLSLDVPKPLFPWPAAP